MSMGGTILVAKINNEYHLPEKYVRIEFEFETHIQYLFNTFIHSMSSMEEICRRRISSWWTNYNVLFVKMNCISNIFQRPPS